MVHKRSKRGLDEDFPEILPKSLEACFSANGVKMRNSLQTLIEFNTSFLKDYNFLISDSARCKLNLDIRHARVLLRGLDSYKKSRL